MSTSTFHQTQQNIAQFQVRDKLMIVFDQVDFQFVKNDGKIVISFWDIVHKSNNDCSFRGQAGSFLTHVHAPQVCEYWRIFISDAEFSTFTIE